MEVAQASVDKLYQVQEERRKPYEPRVLDEKDPYFEERREIERVRKSNPEKA